MQIPENCVCIMIYRLQYSQTLQSHRLQSKDINQMFTAILNNEGNQAIR